MSFNPLRRPGPAIFLGYFALTLVWMYPLLPALGRGLPNDPGDPLLNTWIIWWNARVVPFSTEWWNAPSFYPLTGVAAFTELLVSLNLIASPVIWITGNAVLAYNVVFLLSFPLSAFAAYALCLELTGDRRAAIVGGLAFGFAPYRIAQLPHIQVLASFWMPVALLGLHRYVRTHQTRWLVLFAASWLLQGLSNGYFLLFFSIFVPLWILWFVRPREWRTLGAIVAALVLAALPVVPILLGYQTVQSRFGFTRRLEEILFYSADVTSFLAPPPKVLAWGWFQSLARPEGELFPGVTIVALIVVAIVLTWRAVPRERLSRIRLLLAIGAAVAAVMAISVLVFGAWKIQIGQTVLLSVGRFHKPFFNVVLCSLAFFFSGPRFLAAFKRRSALVFYALGAVLGGLMCLGPEPRFLGEQILSKPPYALLLELPGFKGLRVPTRFWMVAVLCLAAAGALAFARLSRRWPRRANLVAVVCCAGIALDAWPGPVPVAEVPAPVTCAPEHAASAAAFVQLPLGSLRADLRAMYRSAGRGLPAVNGYSGYYPPHYVALDVGLRRLDERVLVDLASFGTLEVAVEGSGDPHGRWREFVMNVPGARELPGCAASGVRLFDIPRQDTQKTPRASGRRLAIASLTTDESPETVQAMTDGDLQTRWSAGPQLDPHWLLIDLGRERAVTGLVMSLGPFLHDFPRRLLIEHSRDGVSWTRARNAGTHREAFWGAIREPRVIPVELALRIADARYVRLTQIGRDRVFYWSIAELAVLGR